MQSKSHARLGFEIVLIIIIGGVCLLSRLQVHSQTTTQGVPDRVSNLVGMKAEVSKLDWILVTARIRNLEEMVAKESSRSVRRDALRPRKSQGDRQRLR